ncbi:Coenzyme F420 hydrogenase/dehydrogenase, beta subunit C-terminal domain [uncultured Desulfobacter sp.]|uniref:Coenzyme F420 hydrogenase/dehydrogenase, beta subunit C-terminal domain n=1 Tax=uncultured Desulfobacter sp. TaxID=240139 RepID=UPI0029F4ECF3|nr:Coenzyme F420 hydrogenase/dehydrogenase, beta subunit C-terminal domain [uncultured Desulfobacter sp.]
MRIKDVVKNNLCIGCGICSYDKNIIEFKYSKFLGIDYPLLDNNNNYNSGTLVCPGKGYEIINKANKLYGGSNYSIELGYVHKCYASHSNNRKILKNASSGGVMTELLIYLLEKKIVDKVAVTKFIYTNQGPRTKTFLTNDINKIIESQGSKYCPVNVSNVLTEIKHEEGRIAYLGTPCQIAGIRQIQEIDEDFKNTIIFTIANFCGGFKNHNNIRKLSCRHSINYKQIKKLRFRGGGQPGSMIIEDNSNRFEVQYPDYTGYTGYSKLLRCQFCIDATGELADFALGDAWLEPYISDPNPWSVIITRNNAATKIIENMKNAKIITSNSITERQVCLSQKTNLKSKKDRQSARSKLYSVLGYKTPNYDGGYQHKTTSIIFEIKVFFVYKFKYILELTGLYKYLRSFLGKKY